MEHKERVCRIGKEGRMEEETEMEGEMENEFLYANKSFHKIP